MPATNTEIRSGLLTIHRADEGAFIRLALHGELDLANVVALETSIEEALACGVHVLVDLGKLEFLDSTGISLLVMAQQGPGADRLTFLPSESPEVCRLLHLTGLDQRLGLSSPLPPAPA